MVKAKERGNRTVLVHGRRRLKKDKRRGRETEEHHRRAAVIEEDPVRRSMDGVRRMQGVMGLDKKNGGQHRRTDMAAKSKQRHQDQESRTRLGVISGSEGIRMVKMKTKTIRELGFLKSKKMEGSQFSSMQGLKDEFRDLLFRA